MIGAANGITTNGSSKIWVADSQAKNIVEFDVDYETGSLKQNQRIQIGSFVDNLHYDKTTGNIMLGII